MKILVIDGQGGGLGKQIVSSLRSSFENIEIIAVGTNSLATAAMLKAGADRSATGENPVKVCARSADIIIGPVGIVNADSMLGEVTADMALAVSQSSASRILIPVNLCDNYVVGVQDLSLSTLVQSVVERVRTLIGE